MPLTVLDLNRDGLLVYPKSGSPIPVDLSREFLTELLSVREDDTDIFVFVHGWNTSRGRAVRTVTEFANKLLTQVGVVSDAYPYLKPFRPRFVLIRWPSASMVTPTGYRRIRSRAHTVPSYGLAPAVIGHLLGYLDEERRRPSGREGVLASRAGQYLHVVGHSFGGSFVAEAVTRAAGPYRAGVLGRKRPAFAVDSCILVQLAARPDAFDGQLNGLLLDQTPLRGPVVLTYSKHDWALRFWHRVLEGAPGVGAVGARSAVGSVPATLLLQVDERYQPNLWRSPLVNVDCSWRFRKKKVPEGAHSDCWHPETAHLILSVADAARDAS